MNDPLRDAILAASEELAAEHGWCFDGDPGVPPEPDHFFVEIMHKHLAPMVDLNSWKAARIASLQAELAALQN